MPGDASPHVETMARAIDAEAASVADTPWPGTLIYQCSLCGLTYDAFIVTDFKAAARDIALVGHWPGKPEAMRTIFHDCGPDARGVARFLGGKALVP